MTREQFKKIEEEHGIMEAINMFSEECNDIYTTDTLEYHAKDVIDKKILRRRRRYMLCVADK